MSSINGVASSTSTNPYQASTVQSAFQKLAQALQSGDLAAAQQAYSILQQNAPQGTSSTSGQTSSQNSFAALGQALASGNLAAAQQAFSQIQQAGGHHHHHHHHGSQGSLAASASTSAPAASSTESTTPSSTGANVSTTA